MALVTRLVVGDRRGRTVALLTVVGLQQRPELGDGAGVWRTSQIEEEKQGKGNEIGESVWLVLGSSGERKNGKGNVGELSENF